VSKLKSAPGRALALAAALTAFAIPALAQDRVDARDRGASDADYRLVGAGVPRLLPELRRTPRGRAFVMRDFDRNQDGRIARREADAANRAYLRMAGANPERFDWDRRDIGRPVAQQREWDRRGMRGYRMRQTERGATFDLQDVLFETGSAHLRSGAAERLRPLASYLSANPEVPVRIDGHTDSVGTNAANQLLSERRAEAVRTALSAMGAGNGEVVVAGHGETMPVAGNADAAGRQRNRRVEVTLVGQQARSFSE